MKCTEIRRGEIIPRGSVNCRPLGTGISLYFGNGKMIGIDYKQLWVNDCVLINQEPSIHHKTPK